MENDKIRNQYLITRMKGKIFSFLLQDGKAAEIHCDEESADSILGNIYIGKIKNIAKQIGAAFVEIAPGQVCYLPLSDCKNPVYTQKGSSRFPQAGDELLVQVSREGIKTKFPSVTTNITLHGKYMLLTTGNRQLSVSSKLSGQEKERLLSLIRKMEAAQKLARAGQNPGQEGTFACQVPEKAGSGDAPQAETRAYGWLLRTNAGAASEELLQREFQQLIDRYGALMRSCSHRTCFSCLYRTPASWISRLSDLYDSASEKILTDDPSLYEKLREYLLAYQKEDVGKLSLYENALLPMTKLYSLEHQLSEALAERVWLKSGGYLVIQPTEALTVIDVNTGKYEGGKNTEAAFLKINLEAASEAARQIRLRNLSGIILIDFINLESEASVATLLSNLKNNLRRDPIQTVLVDMTKLSLVEITRKKVEKTLAESLDFCIKSD